MRVTMRVTGAVLLMATALIPVQLHAQRGRGFPGQAGPNMGQSLEVVLEKQEELGLNQDQITQLQELKDILDTQVSPVIDEMAGVRDMIRGGELDRDEGLRQMEALRGLMITNAAPVQGRIQQIITVEQHRTLRSAVRQDRLRAVRAGNDEVPGAVGSRGGGTAQSPRIGVRGSGLGGKPGLGGLPCQRWVGQGSAPGYRGINPAVSGPVHRGVARGYGRGPGSPPFIGNRKIGGLPPDRF